MSTRKERLYAYLKEQLTQSSTIRAIIVLAAGGLGYALDHIEEYTVIGILVGQVIALMLPDSFQPTSTTPTQPIPPVET